MNKITIPKEFQIGGRTVSVEKHKYLPGERVLGRSNYVSNTINLAMEVDCSEVPKDSIEATFYHELVHFIFDSLGEYELSSNERLVESFSALLHQFEKTKK